MRVAIMAWYGPRFRGVWNYYLNMGRVLRAHSPEVRICIFHSPGLGDNYRQDIEEATGEPGREMEPASRLNDVIALAGIYDRRFAQLCRDAEIDVVFEQARFLGRNFPVPILPWIGDLQHRSLPSYFSPLHRMQRDVGFYAQTTFRKHVVVSSKSAKDDLLKFIPHPRAKIHVVPFALRLTEEITDEKIDQVRRAYNLNFPYLFLPNQLWRHKNHTSAIKAIAILTARGHPWTLVMSGQNHDYRYPEYSAEINQLIQSLGVSNQIRWLGVVPYNDLLCLTAGAAALLNPSLFEGWSTTVEEAKILGTPMILSDISVHREQAQDISVLFDQTNPEAMADAIELNVMKSMRSRSGIRLKAQVTNLVDQRLYAERLVYALKAAIDN